MKLNAKTREVTGSKVKKLRRENEFPAVLYGKGVDNINVSLNLSEFTKTYKEAGENTVMNLHIKGGDKKEEERNVLIYKVDFDPVSDAIIHADLYEVDMKKEVSANVSLVFKNESHAIKVDNGILVKVVYEIEVTALPNDLPHEIVVDLALLKTFDDVITVADLNIPENVKISMTEDEVIASVTPPRSEEELEALSEDTTPVNLEDVKSEADEKKEEKEKEEKEGADKQAAPEAKE